MPLLWIMQSWETRRNPGKIIKRVIYEMIAWKTEGTRLYQDLPHQMQQHWKECAALIEVPADRHAPDILFKT